MNKSPHKILYNLIVKSPRMKKQEIQTEILTNKVMEGKLFLRKF